MPNQKESFQNFKQKLIDSNKTKDSDTSAVIWQKFQIRTAIDESKTPEELSEKLRKLKDQKLASKITHWIDATLEELRIPSYLEVTKQSLEIQKTPLIMHERYSYQVEGANNLMQPD
ncbi:hypothetical protein L3V86_06205 [Thiotrichales bacterium 19S11-10]|nr:hypothetical protein [Thiotrichales bacterium 19S11-10]